MSLNSGDVYSPTDIQSSISKLEENLHKLFNKQEVLEDKKYCYVKQIDYLNSENINNEQKTFYKELEDKFSELYNSESTSAANSSCAGLTKNNSSGSRLTLQVSVFGKSGFQT